MARKKRSIHSIKKTLLIKSREAIIAAVQIYNNPLITFKSETFITLCIIAWTYLLHAYYREKGINYAEREKASRKYRRTPYGAKMYWSLGKCLDQKACPLDSATKENLKFLIGIRNEIEHQMTLSIDQTISAKLQACCINYNRHIRELFGDRYRVDTHLAISIQFSPITPDQYMSLSISELPPHLQNYIGDFERSLDKETLDSGQYAYRVIFVPKLVNREGQADQVVTFINPDSPIAQDVNKQLYVVQKDTEKPKYLPKTIVKHMKELGYEWFTMNQHTALWQEGNTRREGSGYGVFVGKQWYWYKKWVDYVEEYCKKTQELRSKQE